MLSLAACVGTPDVEVTALADGRFLYATVPAGELPEPDVMGAVIEEGEARCQKDGKTSLLDSATVTRDGKQFDEHFYTCVAP
ncbi:MAG: hypothetical protein B7Z38_03040 [Rhodobacterales bacterium 12-64-8]|nr:MAG: hypothetical protein B7Z38_03040 [Rhodobacterales bacterium 12-64-8]